MKFWLYEEFCWALALLIVLGSMSLALGILLLISR